MNLEDVSLFVEVVKQKSFTKAADHYDIPKSTLSRRIRNLENDLRTRLLDRTTRKVTLTDVGQRFYQRSCDLLWEAEKTRDEIASFNDGFAGTLVIYGPDLLFDINRTYITEFCKRYPELSLELRSSVNWRPNDANCRYDLHIAIGEQPDSSLIAHPVGSLQIGFYHAPSLETTQHLPENKFALLRQLTSSDYLWNEKLPEQPVNILCRSDSVNVLAELAKSGLAITCLPKFCVADYLADGTLVEFAPSETAFTLPVYSLYPSRRFIPKRISTLLEEIRLNLHKGVHKLENKV